MFNEVIPLNIGVSTFVPGAYFPGFNDSTVMPGVDAVKRMHIRLLFEHYHQTLLISEKYKAWFRSRSIEISDEIIQRFQLGFADSSIGKKVSREYGRQSEYFRGNMQQLGLYKSTGYPYFHGDIVVPVCGEGGTITAAYGRRVTDEHRARKLYYRHWSIEQPVLFNLEVLEKYPKVILCKTPVEALTLICAGIENVVSTLGMYCFGAEHLSLLERSGVEEVTVAFDNSDQGNHVSGLIAQSLNASGIFSFRLPLPKNHDVNLFAQRYSDTKASLKHLVNSKFPFSQSYESLIGR